MSEHPSVPRDPGATDPDMRVCAVCGRVLDRYDGADAQGWVHTLQDGRALADGLDYADHPVVPVPPSQLPTYSGRCDFCNTDLEQATAWVLPCREFIVAPGHISDGDFALCAECASALRDGGYPKLAMRVYRFAAGPGLERPSPETIVGWINRIAEHATGAPAPLARPAG